MNSLIVEFGRPIGEWGVVQGDTYHGVYRTTKDVGEASHALLLGICLHCYDPENPPKKGELMTLLRQIEAGSDKPWSQMEGA